ncbi:hypothetical protein BD311DRAFT_760255 [Dichomitus squalens]|uniref:Uncharacterized protein n=1 Tax=Dichomitus squalens TaxID=114155 RepID=A0A4Q9MN88_9APHY|nr:hypothetical protein BD311DRAFT_760255 [Dichomitus squalens]
MDSTVVLGPIFDQLSPVTTAAYFPTNERMCRDALPSKETSMEVHIPLILPLPSTPLGCEIAVEEDTPAHSMRELEHAGTSRRLSEAYYKDSTGSRVCITIDEDIPLIDQLPSKRCNPPSSLSSSSHRHGVVKPSRKRGFFPRPRPFSPHRSLKSALLNNLEFKALWNRRKITKEKTLPEKVVLQRDLPVKSKGTPHASAPNHRGELRQPKPRRNYRYTMHARDAINLGLATVHTGAAFLGPGAALEKLGSLTERTPRLKRNRSVYMEHHFQVRRRGDDGPGVPMRADIGAAVYWKRTVGSLVAEEDAMAEEKLKRKLAKMYEMQDTSSAWRFYTIRKRVGEMAARMQESESEWMDVSPTPHRVSEKS